MQLPKKVAHCVKSKWGSVKFFTTGLPACGAKNQSPMSHFLVVNLTSRPWGRREFIAAEGVLTDVSTRLQNKNATSGWFCTISDVQWQNLFFFFFKFSLFVMSLQKTVATADKLWLSYGKSGATIALG